MGKTRAEIQRQYRERKKEKEGNKYLEKERNRVKKYYKPIAEKSIKEIKDRREKVKGWVRKHRQRQREVEANILPSSPDTIDEGLMNSTVNDDMAASTSSLTVKLPFNKTRRRVSRATARQRRALNKLENANVTLTRKLRCVNKRNQRLSHRLQHAMKCKTVQSSNRTEEEHTTPRKRTMLELRQQGVTPSKLPKATVKKLVLANVVADEVKEARKENNRRGKTVINRIMSGRIVKLYRLKTVMGKYIGIDRHTLKSTSKKTEVPKYKRLHNLHLMTKGKVDVFLRRDDNSRQMPGKKDYKTTEGQQKQKRILCDSLKNLYMKFKSEEPDIKMSFTTFSRMRPKEFSLTKYLSRNQCLCQKHQNFAMLLKAAKANGAAVVQNPEEFVKQVSENNPNETMAGITTEKVIYEQWKRVDCDDGKKRTKIVQNECSKAEFTTIFVKQTCEFQEHVDKIKRQYQAINDLKRNLPQNHIIVQMDFAENFSCSAADEIQSAYWNQAAITLHPVVVYYLSEDGELKHYSYMFVSDDFGHNAGAVFSFLKRLLPILHNETGEIEHVHYWTDSPSSQYRNKSIFCVVSCHSRLFQCTATWNYFEVGHGKGPCDGLGGTAKRMDDLSVRQHKCSIQDAKSFVEWGKRFNSSIVYILVSTHEMQEARKELDQLCEGVIPLKGTMKLHAVISAGEMMVKSRITSCYCQNCLEGNYHTDWIVGVLKKGPRNETDEASATTTNDATLPLNSMPDNDTEQIMPCSPEVNQFVAAVYDGQWYAGEVHECDVTDNTYLISFLETSTVKGSTTWKWPRSPDLLWIKKDHILSLMKEPEPLGRCARTFKLDSNDLERVEALFAMF